MAIKITYDGDQRLILPPIDCDCNLPHNRPAIDIYVGTDILKNCAAYIKKGNYGTRALLVADKITYQVAGSRVERYLQEAGFQVKLSLLEREEALEPDQSALGEVLLNLDPTIEFLVAVGSGTITDTTRYVAFTTGKPFVSVGTAASMDGYVSVVAPLLHNGLKVNKPATYPKTLICDLEIIRQAPYEMTLAGFGDVIGKYIAVADWMLGRAINGEDYCPACVELVNQAVANCVANAAAIRNQTAAGIQSLLEALVLAGLSILIIGNTRPVASVEHNMAHYWEMMKLLRHEKAPSHGLSVGVATGYVLRFFEEFLRLDLAGLDPAAVLAKRPSRAAAEQLVLQKYGAAFGRTIIRENPDIYLDDQEQLRRIGAFLGNRERLRAELAALLPSWRQLMDTYRQIGFPGSAAEVGIDRGLLEDALICAKDYRKRYSVFNLAHELGVLDELIAKVID
jgi:glycerol-1-phosphate dehydrogenase [NAD(P)+]